jgi:hypothetical protein
MRTAESPESHRSDPIAFDAQIELDLGALLRITSAAMENPGSGRQRAGPGQ